MLRNVWVVIALASMCPVQVYAQVVDVQYLTTFESQNNAGAPNVNIEQYSSSIPSGGGQFVIGKGPAQTNCTADHGVILKDNGGLGNCYYRQFAGPVHLAWYGVADANSTVCLPVLRPVGCNADAQLAAAFAASLAAGLGGDGGVVTDGRAIALSQSAEIPPNQYLSCGGPPGGERKQLPLNSTEPYYLVPHSIVLTPGFPLVRDAHSLLQTCIIRPDWYADQLQALANTPGGPTTRALIDDIEHKFSGTATVCGGVDPDTGQPTVNGEACDMKDVMIIGFDTCDDTANSARAVLQQVKYDCNVGEALHANGGGMSLRDGAVHNFVEALMHLGNDPGSTDISLTKWQITSFQQDPGGSGEVQVTIANAPDYISNGDTVIISGLPLGIGPVAQNGRWIAECSGTPTCGGTFKLKASLWTGPTHTGASWNGSTNVISVSDDTTDIAGGEYVCASGSSTPAPFCSAPGNFGASSTTLRTDLNSTDIDVNVKVDSTANWPQWGLVCMPTPCSSSTSEYLAYRVVDATHIKIIARNADDHLGNHSRTMGENHNGTTSPETIQPSAPLVIAPVPSLNRVIVNAATSSIGSGDVAFQNDPFAPDSATNQFCASTDGSAPCGYAFLNTNYRTWTANTAAGSTPDAALTVNVISHAGDLLTLASPYAFRLQEGMSVVDLSGGGSVVGFVDLTPTVNNQVHINGSSGLAGHQVRFVGCGYPGLIDKGTSRQPWLGNCAATAYLFYGTSADYGASGVACDSIRSHGWRVYFHMNNGQETVCNKVIFDSGSHGTGTDNGVTADPTSIGIWVEADGDKIEIADGKAEARTGFLNTGTAENNGVALANFNLVTSSDYSLVFANSGRSNLGQLHGAADGAGYADSSELGLTLVADDMPASTIYYDDPTKLATLHCANDSFAAPFCNNLLNHTAAGGATPTVPGGASVTGNDGAGRVMLGASPGMSFTLTFAIPWASTPVCFAQDETTTGRNPVVASAVTPASVTFRTNNSTGFNGTDKISYQCTGFK